MITWPFSAVGIAAEIGGAPKIIRSACSATIARPKVSSSENRIRTVEPPEQHALDHDAEQGDRHRRRAASEPPKPR